MHEFHPTWLNALERLIPEAAHAYISVNVLSGWVVIVVLLVMARLGTSRLVLRPISKGQVVWEWLYETFEGLCKDVIGPGGERFTAFLGTLFIYIVGLNLLGVVPGFISPTASLTMTFALSLPVILSVQVFGIQVHGWRYVLHFVGDPWWLFPINIPIHLVGEVARALSLAVRLFGNIFGEDTVIAQLLFMGAGIFAATHVPLPLHFPMILFHIFISFVQALVFTILSAAYISGAVATHGEQHDEVGTHDEALEAA